MKPIDRLAKWHDSGAIVSRLVVEATERRVNGRRVWRLKDDLSLNLPFTGGLFRLRVPAEFETDYASIPRILWWLFPHDECAEAAVFHDWLYERTDLDRFFADSILRLVMKLTDKPWLMRVLFFWGVRCGGWRRVKTTDTGANECLKQ